MTEAAVPPSRNIFCPGTTLGGKRPPPNTTGRPFTWGARASLRRPAGQGGRPGGSSRGALPGERSPKLLGCEGGEATRPPCSPSSWPGARPPTCPVPCPGTSSWPRLPPHCLQPSSSETASEAVYASFAAVARRMSAWGQLRTRKGAAAARRRRKLAGLPVGLSAQRLSASVRAEGWGSAGRDGANKQDTRPRPLRHSTESAAARANGGSQRRGTPPPWRWGAGPGGGRATRPAEKQPLGNELPRGANPRVGMGSVRRELCVHCGWKMQREPSGFSWKAKVSLSQHQQLKACPPSTRSGPFT